MVDQSNINVEKKEKIQNIVDDIVKSLNLIEVAYLRDCLKEALGVTDIPMGSMMPAAGAGGSSASSEEDSAPQKQSYDVKMKSFESGKKLAVIKAIRDLNSKNGKDLNLKEAKDLVSDDNLPVVILSNVPKDKLSGYLDTLKDVGVVAEAV